MTDFLEQVIASRREHVRDAKARRPAAELLGSVVALRRRPGAFRAALLRRRSEGRLAVIAEVKRVSPAHGPLGTRAGFDVVTQAARYEAAGAAAISVLAEPRFWGGSVDDVRAVVEAVRVPVLFKDVVVDEYQLLEARAAGADAVLLVAEVLTDAELRRMRERAAELLLDTLVEAHESAAFGRAVASGSRVVGVNARDLRAPSRLDPGRARLLHSFVRDDQVFVAESGIETVDHARTLPARVDAVLVGTALMRAEDPAPLIRSLGAVRRGAPEIVAATEDRS